jgi:hypothetical protein
MSEGLSVVLARVSQLEAMLSPPVNTGSTSGTDFQDALGQATAGTGSGTGAQAVTIASKYLGTPYRWGGTDPKTGLDCSGLTQLVFRQLGVDLPRVAADQSRSGTKVDSMKDAQPGDLLFFGSPAHHVGIYVGGGKMIDAPHTGTKVQIQDVYATPSQIRRVLPSSSTTSGPPSVSGAGLSSSALSALLGTAGTGGSPNGSTGSLGTTPYASLFSAAGKRYGIDPALLSAVAKAESGYNAGAVSGAGARGLMQLMPSTARSLGVNPDVPAQAVDGAARLLSSNLHSFHGRVDLALAAYNAGPGAVRKYNGIPPYPETRNYVQKVQQYWGQLR